MPRLTSNTVAQRQSGASTKHTRAPRKSAHRKDKGKAHKRRMCPCGRLACTGWSTRGPHETCAICAVVAPRLVPRPGKQSTAKEGICACCGREGRIVGLGLRSACYQARRKYGLLEEWKRFRDGWRE